MTKTTHLSPEEVRSESIKFRATPAQKRRIEQLARRCAITISDYVLSRSFNYEPKPRTTALEEQLCTELSSVRTDYILNVAFAKNHLPPRTSKTLKTDATA
jgi:hypothetical protein